MDFTGSWNDKKYQELINYLSDNSDKTYQEFLSRVVVSDKVFGLKTPFLKKIAKEISKSDYQSFIMINTSDYYELTMIEGLLYGYLKVDTDNLLTCLDTYFQKVNSWAHVDSTVANLKQFKKMEDIGFKYAKKLIHSKKNFSKRAGILILLNYYLHDKYIDKILEIVSKIRSNDYYVKMAVAWLMSVAYIKYKEKTLIYLVNIQDDFIFNKTLDKIVDSRRISADEKAFIKSLKNRNNKKNGS